MDASGARTFVTDNGSTSTSTTATLNGSTQNDDCDILGAFVAREIRQIAPGTKRRMLEADIQELILKAKREALSE